jgi:hypothetical protein
MMLAPWPGDTEIERIGCLDEQVDGWAAIVEQDRCSPSAGDIQERGNTQRAGRRWFHKMNMREPALS